MDVSIVTPVFNEEENIRPLLAEIDEVMSKEDLKFEIVAVDDGSEDTSFERLKSEVEDKDYLKIVKLRSNYGQSKALQAGIDNSDGSTVVTIDSDLQNDPSDIPRLLNELEKTKSNVLSGFRSNRMDSIDKKMASWIASKLRLFLFENNLTDYGCTLKAFEREAIDLLDLHEGMHRYIPVLLEKEDLEISEIEVNHRERHSGQSKYGLYRLPKGFFDMIGLWLSKKYDNIIHYPSQNKPDYAVEEIIG